MSSFEDKLEYLEDLVFEEEDYSKAQDVIMKMIESSDDKIEKEDFAEFLSTAADAIEDIESSETYNRVTDWAIGKYNQAKDTGDESFLDIADSVISWLSKKLELADNSSTLRESKLSLSLFSDVVENDVQEKDACTLTNDFQGYATYSLIIGLAEKNNVLIDQAIEAQQKVLYLYENGEFPDYYNLDTFVALAKRSLAETLMEAYEFNNALYTQHYGDIGTLLRNAAKALESCGTDFDKDYNANLIVRYEGLPAYS